MISMHCKKIYWYNGIIFISAITANKIYVKVQYKVFAFYQDDKD